MKPKPDLHGYVLGELSEAERRQVEQAASADAECAADLERLLLTRTALRHLPEEEPLRRIAFVSDKVFEPRWWEAWWHSAPRLAFLSAGLLSCAILTHAVLTRPQPSQPVTTVAGTLSSAQVERIVREEVGKAVSAVRLEHEKRSAQLVTAALDEAEKKYALERESTRLAVEENFSVLRKQMANMVKMYASYEPASTGGIR